MLIHHFGLTVPDLEIAADWYGRAVGYLPFAKTRNEDLNLDMVLLKSESSDCYLELFFSPGQTRPEPEFSDIPAHLPFEGWRHPAFIVSNIAAELERVANDGIEVISQPVSVEEFGYRYAFLRDPFGNLVELVEKM